MAFRNQNIPGSNGVGDVSQNPQPVVVPAAGAGQYTGEDHSWESLVFVQGRPPLDWELNLLQEVTGAYGFRRHFKRLLPSCFLTGQFMESSSVVPGLTFLSAVTGNENKFQVAGADVVVNGWAIQFDLTESATPGVNQITMPAPPASGNRTDLVILEVWRQLVAVAVTPPTNSGKSASGQLFRYGNVKAPDASPPGNVNLLDDLQDPTMGKETARRVQIQYRYRVVQGIASLAATPDGFGDPAVVANTVPASGLTLDGTATTYLYAPHPDDPGLWIAGNSDQTSATALGTEDGAMYAVPLFAVFRRNSAPFDRANNLNGATAISSGTSDRPDGLFSDQIVAGDVKDLRRSVAWDLTEVREKAFQQALDNSLSTEHEITQNGAEFPPYVGPSGTSFTVRDDIGVSGHVGNPDSIRMNFSDRSVTESIVCKVALLAGATTATFSLSSLPVWWSASPVNVLATAPSGAAIVGLGQVRLVDATATADIDMTASASVPHVRSAVMSTVIGPGVDEVVVTFSAGLTNAASLFVELLIEYPSGSGVRRNVVENDDGTVGVAVWTPPALNIAGWVNSAALTATSDAQRYLLSSSDWWMDAGHRELSMRLPATSQALALYAADTLSVWIPEVITGLVTVNDGTNPAYTTTDYSFNSSYSKVVLSFPVPVGTVVNVTYTPQRPAPLVSTAPGDSYQVFYRTRAVQSVAVPSGQQTLYLLPRSVAQDMYVVSSGSGSPDDGFPFVAPSAQIPVALLPAASYPEAVLDAPAALAVVGLGVNTGFMKVPCLVPYLPDPQQVQLFKDTPDVTVDADGRNFWPKSQYAPGATRVLYAPQLYGQVLQFKQRHKTAYPVLMELREDFQQIGRKGTLVLVVFTRWTDYDNQNSVLMSPTAGDSGAAVYRLRGNLLNPRRAAP